MEDLKAVINSIDHYQINLEEMAVDQPLDQDFQTLSREATTGLRFRKVKIGDNFLYVDISNKTSVDIWYLYMSPQSSDSWEEDVLGEDVLLAGDDFTVDLVGYDECIWDFKAVFADEEEVELYEVNVCEENVTFYE